MRKILLPCLLTVLTYSSIFGQDFKVVGYLLYSRFDLMDQIALDKLTHLNIAFLNPDMEGNLQVPSGNIDAAIQQGHEAGLEVFISLAGGYLTPAWAAAWSHLMKASNRSAFIHKIITYALERQVQGVDVDLEWQYVDDLYSGFVLELSDSLRAHDLQMTAALPGTYRYPDINKEALAAYDWINMMVYDLRGPWDPSNAGPHSPMSFANQSISYWQAQGVPAEKLTLGVPFYGYDFSNPSGVKAYTYRTILSWDEANAQKDNTGKTYYNGIPTIKAKTQLALEKLSGIMIWEIGQDDFGDYSLLNAIQEEIIVTDVPDLEPDELSIQIFPNPFMDQIQISLPLQTERVRLFDAMGRLLQEREVRGLGNITLPAADLIPGIYYLSVQIRSLKNGTLVGHAGYSTKC